MATRRDYERAIWTALLSHLSASTWDEIFPDLIPADDSDGYTGTYVSTRTHELITDADERRRGDAWERVTHILRNHATSGTPQRRPAP